MKIGRIIDLLSKEQLKELDKIARRNESSIAEEILKCINIHIDYHTNKIDANPGIKTIFP